MRVVALWATRDADEEPRKLTEFSLAPGAEVALAPDYLARMAMLAGYRLDDLYWTEDGVRREAA